MSQYHHFTMFEREKILFFRTQNKSIRFIAKELGRSPSSVSRELKRNSVNNDYSPSQAEKKYKIDKSQSFMIGDKLSDVKSGRNYGIKSILVATGYGEDFKSYTTEYDGYAENLLLAVKKYIIGDWLYIIIESELDIKLRTMN